MVPGILPRSGKEASTAPLSNRESFAQTSAPFPHPACMLLVKAVATISSLYSSVPETRVFIQASVVGWGKYGFISGAMRMFIMVFRCFDKTKMGLGYSNKLRQLCRVLMFFLAKKPPVFRLKNLIVKLLTPKTVFAAMFSSQGQVVGW